MEFGEIFSDAFKYPLSDYTKWLIVGVIFVLISLMGILAQFGFYNENFTMIWGIVAFILSILIYGYGISVLKDSIDLYDEIPEFDWLKNFVDGIKCVIIAIVYYIIPSIIVMVIGFATGYAPLSKILTESNMEQFLALGPAPTPNDIFAIVPQQVWNDLIFAIGITVVIAIIIFLIFTIFANIALCRFAKYDSMGEAFNFGEVFSDVKQIGILKILLFLIVLAIILAILGFVTGLFTMIPIIGLIIVSLIGDSFLFLFSNRALGLLYSEI